jgi:hypothetical protein
MSHSQSQSQSHFPSGSDPRSLTQPRPRMSAPRGGPGTGPGAVELEDMKRQQGLASMRRTQGPGPQAVEVSDTVLHVRRSGAAADSNPDIAQVVKDVKQYLEEDKNRHKCCCGLSIKHKDVLNTVSNFIVIGVMVILLSYTLNENRKLNDANQELQSQLSTLLVQADLSIIKAQNTRTDLDQLLVQQRQVDTSISSAIASGNDNITTTLATSLIQLNDTHALHVHSLQQQINTSMSTIQEAASNSTSSIAALVEIVTEEGARVDELKNATTNLRRSLDTIPNVNTTQLSAIVESVNEFGDIDAKVQQLHGAFDAWKLSNLTDSSVNAMVNLSSIPTAAVDTMMALCGAYVLLHQRTVTATLAPCDGSDTRCAENTLNKYLYSSVGLSTGGRSNINLQHSHSVSGTTSSSGSHSHSISGSASGGSHSHPMSHNHKFARVEWDSGSSNGMYVPDPQVTFSATVLDMFRLTDSNAGANPSHGNQHTRFELYTGSSSSSTTSETSHSHSVSGSTDSTGAHEHTASWTTGTSGNTTETLNPTYQGFAVHKVICA